MNKRKYLKECIIRDIAAELVTELSIPYDQALSLFYKSTTFDKLMDDETGLYLYGSDYVYDLFACELNFGRFVQMEV